MSDICDRLKEWGVASVARHARQHDGPSHGESILEKNKDLAPGTRENFARAVVARDGRSRRRYMATNLAACGIAMVPLYACDPVPARNDASHPVSHSNAWVDIGLPDEARPIDDAIAQMARTHPIRAAIVREEFTTTGKQEIKAGRVQARYGGKLTLRQYRHELEKAKEWLRGRIG
jgi:hypothetical protein